MNQSRTAEGTVLKNRQNQLRFCQRTTSVERLSILLVGSHEFCNLMQQCIYDVHQHRYKTEVTASISESIESILLSKKDLHIDFIVFLMDTARRQSIEQVERDICLLDPVYLCDKTILIDGCNNLSPAYLAVSYDELFNLAQKYHLHVLHGNIQDENSRNQLANRIIKFAATVCGRETGTPSILHFPVDKFPL